MRLASWMPSPGGALAAVAWVALALVATTPGPVSVSGPAQALEAGKEGRTTRPPPPKPRKSPATAGPSQAPPAPAAVPAPAVPPASGQAAAVDPGPPPPPIPPALMACRDDLMGLLRQFKAVPAQRMRQFVQLDPDLRARIRDCYPKSEDEADYFHGMDFADLLKGWVVGWNGRILATVDGGAHWSEQASGTRQHLLAVRFVDAEHGYTTGFGGTVLRTTDGGARWDPATRAGQGDLWSLSCIDRLTCWTSGTTPGVVYVTRDGGARWEEERVPTQATVRSLQFLDDTHGFAASMDGQVLSTDDGGLTWVTRLARPSQGLVALRFIDRRTGWVVGDGGTILKTRDAGETWEDQSGNVRTGSAAPGPLGFNTLAFVDADRGWAAGSMGVIVATTDGGATWRIQRPPHDHEITLYAMHAQNRSVVLAAGNMGNIAATLDGGADWLWVRGPAREVFEVVTQYLADHVNTPAPVPAFKRDTQPGDARQWPFSSMGSLWISGAMGRGCSATLVAPRVVVSAATCIAQANKLVDVTQLHFTADPARGLSALHSGIEKVVVSPAFDPATWRPFPASTNWALLVLKDDLHLKPVPVRAMAGNVQEAFRTVTEAGYSVARPYLPSITAGCPVSSHPVRGTFVYDCLTDLTLSGAAVLAQIDGQTVLVGIAAGLSDDSEPIRSRSAATSVDMFLDELNGLAGP